MDELVIAFYRSPFAQKMGSVQSKFDAEIMNLSVKWFVSIR
jgi:hypothetical protein